MTHYLTQGDTGAQIKVALSRKGSSTAVDLNTGVAVLKVRAEKAATNAFTVTGTKDLTNDNEAIFVLGDNMTGITPGRYTGEIEVTFTIDSVESVETVYEVVSLYIREQY